MRGQVTYFPYLSLKDIDVITIPELDVKIWNFDRKADEYIKNEEIKSHITSILKTNKRGIRPVENVGVLIIGRNDNRVYKKEELNLANEVRLLLFICFSAVGNIVNRGANSGWQMATSENFGFITQNFEIGNERISERSGQIVSMSIMGSKISEHEVRAPAHILQPQRFSYDAEMLNALLKLKLKRPRVYELILRSIEMLYRAYYNDPTVDMNSRILLLVASFEILLQLPSTSQRLEFKNDIAALSNDNSDKYLTYFTEIHGKKYIQIGSMKEKWADRIYNLRNKIIHGNKLTQDDYNFEGKQSHIQISLLFLIFCIRKRIDKSLRTKKFQYDEINWVTYIESGFEDEENVEEFTHTGFIYDKNEFAKALFRYGIR